MTHPTASSSEPSAQQKSAARLIAVQAIYMVDIDPTSIEHLANPSRLVEFYRKDADVSLAADPDALYLGQLIDKTREFQSNLDLVIQSHLLKGWTLERLLPIVRSVLRVAVCELSEKRDVDSNLIVSEYVRIAHCFLQEKDAAFINGILDAIAKSIRS